MLLDWPDLTTKYGIDLTGVIHCGARLGEERDAYVALGCSNVWWIDGNPEIIERLRQNVEPLGHHVVQALLYDVDDEIIPFHVTNNDGMSSSILEFGTHPTLYPTTVFEKDFDLRPSRLDTLVSRFGITGVNFLSMDLQGAEGHCLRGATELLPHLGYVMTEINKEEVYRGCAKVWELDEILGGFKRVETFWVGDEGWGDALFVRRSLL
jgi:FkbM family methyltransferase